MIERLNVFVGYDRRESEAFYVAVKSLVDKSSIPLRVHMLHETNLRACGLYTRGYHYDDERPQVRVDDADGRPFSTDFAFTRFLVPALTDYRGWALFFDCDFLFRADVAKLLEVYADPGYSVSCVQHKHVPLAGAVKMDAQLQQRYACKNWSSFMLFNCSHPNNRLLTPATVNAWRGGDLHSFQWLPSLTEVGEIDERWNWLVNASPTTDAGHAISMENIVGDGRVDESPFAAHFTSGGPWFPEYRDVPFADEWRAVRETLKVAP